MVSGHSFVVDASSGEEMKFSHLESVSIGTIICSTTMLQEPRADIEAHSPDDVILLFCTSSHVAHRIEQHLRAPFEYRQERINRNPLWIYMDLAFLFSEWKEVWDSARCRLTAHDQEAYCSSISTAQELNKTLHKEISGTYVLQEHLRLHISALRKFQQISGRRTSSCREALEIRIEDYLSDLNHHLDTSEVVLKQLRILLGLLGQSVGIWNSQRAEHLHWLLLVFVPLIFVSTLFSINTMSVPAYWYPLVAFLVLSLVVFILTLAEPLRRAFTSFAKNLFRDTSHSQTVSSSCEKNILSHPTSVPTAPSSPFSRSNLGSSAPDGSDITGDGYHASMSTPQARSAMITRSSRGPPMAFQPGHFSNLSHDRFYSPMTVQVDSAQVRAHNNASVEYPRVPVPTHEMRHIRSVDARPLAQATYFPGSSISRTPPMPEVVPVSSSSSEASVKLTRHG
ncbi:hypothetical protein P152DRAFT_344083 [Eremomyces bilateralis CBS 781.70]|uniref:Uncharacterized protein n=1 Tax=Eremomyces bilateralis CBS 781.70 TaxID=1392243 RepID=A0A6G1G3I5_9PEZI|nr:uncharacterized protein P152DRAFT_344083 [Eremomyces bilateralis CBS 781.70]KAF1812613.1 hypothetical protein P152DRAFT_344083 [Eremomyces bilateralis CBS 781.70]